jgi:hypothetical protein
MPDPDPGRRNDAGVGHPLRDPPNRKGDAVIDRPLPFTPEHQYNSKPAPVPDVARPIPSNLENVTDPLPDPPHHGGRRQSKAVIVEPLRHTAE